jgi:hypothetical protein
MEPILKNRRQIICPQDNHCKKFFSNFGKSFFLFSELASQRKFSLLTAVLFSANLKSIMILQGGR